MSTIAIVPFGLVRPETVEQLRPWLAAAYGRETTSAPALRLPAPAYDVARRQYRSTRLLDALAAARRAGWERSLGVADVDLFVPDLNFVFGEADEARGVAVISLWRLRDEGGEDREGPLFQERAAKEAIHELGHTYGLGHCGSTDCVMWFSNTLRETDRKSARLCAAHAASLREHGPWAPG